MDMKRKNILVVYGQKNAFSLLVRANTVIISVTKELFLSQWKFYTSYKPNLMNFTALVITGTYSIV